MGKKKSKIAVAMAAVIEEYRKQRDLTQEELAELADIPYGTFRNIARADVDVKIPDLVAIAAALSTTRLPGGSPDPVLVTAQQLVDAAVERAGDFAEQVSEAAAKTDDLQARRLQKEAEKMSAAEIERRAEAALKDEQMEQQPDEPEAP
ncbi:MAG: hypothetical protein JWR04_185 [Rhodoglobus sp.]|nr:hypothetical protein [Rhodoglobus sp.]